MSDNSGGVKHSAKANLFRDLFSIDEAFEHARQECIKHGYLKGIVEKEDFVMYAQLFSEEAERKALLEDARIEGKAEGMETMLLFALKSGTPESIVNSMAQQTGMDALRLAEIKKQAQRSVPS